MANSHICEGPIDAVRHIQVLEQHTGTGVCSLSAAKVIYPGFNTLASTVSSTTLLNELM